MSARPGHPRLRAALAGVLMAVAGLAGAVEPDEILDDPELEARARALSKELRCLVCRNESIDESNAQLAKDLRILLRERLKAGDSDEEAIAYIVDRYGEYVLLKPRVGGANWILWAAGPAMLLVGGAGAVVYLRRRARAASREPEALSDEEKARLAEILEE